MVLSNVALRSYYLASSAVRSCPWAVQRRCCLATQPRCPGNWQSRPYRHCSHHWHHWAGSPLCCAGKCCWWACSWPTYTWRDLGRGREGMKKMARGERKGAGLKWFIVQYAYWHDREKRCSYSCCTRHLHVCNYYPFQLLKQWWQIWKQWLFKPWKHICNSCWETVKQRLNHFSCNSCTGSRNHTSHSSSGPGESFTGTGNKKCNIVFGPIKTSSNSCSGCGKTRRSSCSGCVKNCCNSFWPSATRLWSLGQVFWYFPRLSQLLGRMAHI